MNPSRFAIYIISGGISVRYNGVFLALTSAIKRAKSIASRCVGVFGSETVIEIREYPPDPTRRIMMSGDEFDTGSVIYSKKAKELSK